MDRKVEQNPETAIGGLDSAQGVAYLIGIDGGTDSIGWAVTDTEYNLIKARGRELWGSYMFDEAQTAESRLMFRAARRRMARVHERIGLLQSLFDGEIAKTDVTFFQRLNDSKLLPEDKDKRIATKYILFGDKGFGDSDYFKRFPTVFHLRAELLNTPPTDIRLLYLACHHIIKNRGHFLFDGQNFDIGDRSTVRNAFAEINEIFTDDGDNVATFATDNIDKAIDIIKDGSITKTDKIKRLYAVLCVDDIKLKEAVKAIAGAKFAVKKLYDLEDCDVQSTFDCADFETEREKIEQVVGPDEMILIDKLKSVYDFGKLAGLLGDSAYISEARVKKYDVHKADLALLKAYIIENCPQKYKFVFRIQKGKENKNVKNYAAYIGMDKHKSYAKARRDEFYAFIKKEVCSVDELRTFALKKIENGDKTAAMFEEQWRTAADRFDTGEFMPKQITSDNGVIPFQLHLAELEKILKTAETAYPFLTECDDRGMTVYDKIIKLMTFRIPYYVGPLGGGKFAWAVRKSGTERVKVNAWNFDDIIDRDESESKFIDRMSGKCSYIPTEDVLPKNSLLYSEATFLNELNNLRINGEKSSGVREMVWQYARSHKGKISKKTIVRLLQNEGVVLENGADSISGIDAVMTTSLTSYNDFYNIIGKRVDTEREMCENIIKWITLFSDKERLVKRIKTEYGKKLTDDEIKRIKALNYSGWGRLSAKLLDGITSDRVSHDGTPRTVIETLRAENLCGDNGRTEYINLTEALTAPRWGFDKVISECTADDDLRISDRMIEELYCSPSVKRAIRRTVDLVKEIVKIQGHPPKKICIEMARGGDDKKKGERTVSRKEQMTRLYKDIVADLRIWNKSVTMPNEIDARKFISDKVFLYYTQMGKCMYTGKPIDFDSLFNTNIYDIDHIYPQSKINDDSLDNRVLVYKKENALKTDNYPISAEIRTNMREFWTVLKEKHLISENKFKRLIRNSPITPEEQADFENRQLVSTRQSTKATATILKKMLPDTEIVYSKASKAADFKNKFGLVKVRELNDLHHAKDAFVNIIVGNTYNEEFGHDARIYYCNTSKPRSDYKLFERPVRNAWDPEWIGRIVKTYKSNRCAVVRFVSEGSGGLFNATIKPAGANNKLIPLKERGAISDTNKYGGYDSATTAYFILVRSKDNKGRQQLSMEAIPILVDKKAKTSSDLVDYLQNRVKLVQPEILISKIRINTLLNIDGSLAYLRGKTNDRITLCNANEVWLESCEDKEDPNGGSIEYLKKVAEFNRKQTEQKRFKAVLKCDEEHDKISADKNIELYDALVGKLGSGIFDGLSMAGQYDYLSADTQRKRFAAMPTETQCIVIMKIVAFMACNSVNLDLTDFGQKTNGKSEAKNAGVNLMSKNVGGKHIRIITQSPTGYYRKEIDLNKFIGKDGE